MFRVSLCALDFEYLMNYSYMLVKTCTYFSFRCTYLYYVGKTFCVHCRTARYYSEYENSSYVLLFPVRLVCFYFILYLAVDAILSK